MILADQVLYYKVHKVLDADKPAIQLHHFIMPPLKDVFNVQLELTLNQHHAKIARLIAIHANSMVHKTKLYVTDAITIGSLTPMCNNANHNALSLLSMIGISKNALNAQLELG